MIREPKRSSEHPGERKSPAQPETTNTGTGNDRGTRSRVQSADAGTWSDTELRVYKSEGSEFRDITRRALHGPAAGDQALPFETRYFEIAPGGWSSLEQHEHPHSVIILCGRGNVVLDDSVHDLRAPDAVYVAPGTLHQFHAAADAEEPFGFICVVPADRDRPRLADEDDRARIGQNPDVAKKIR